MFAKVRLKFSKCDAEVLHLYEIRRFQTEFDAKFPEILKTK